MTTFKSLMLFSIILLSCVQASVAETAKKNASPDKERKAVNIKLSKDYKRTEKGSKIYDTYRRAMVIETDGKQKDEDLQEIAEQRCRELGLEMRQKYFVNFTKEGTNKSLKSVKCSTVKD